MIRKYIDKKWYNHRDDGSYTISSSIRYLKQIPMPPWGANFDDPIPPIHTETIHFTARMFRAKDNSLPLDNIELLFKDFYLDLKQMKIDEYGKLFSSLITYRPTNPEEFHPASIRFVCNNITLSEEFTFMEYELVWSKKGAVCKITSVNEHMGIKPIDRILMEPTKHPFINNTELVLFYDELTSTNYLV